MTSNTNAVWWSMMLARDVDTCSALLRGEPVSPERLHRDWLEFASTFELVRLDTCAIDLLHKRAGLRALLREAA
jgi:NAD-dependent SIR2 family protein deacetylase